MALPRSHVPSLTPLEMEFIAEDELVDIIPLYAMKDPVRLLSGVYGPFRPPTRTPVPLWLAVTLKNKRRCHIIPPEWLSIESLQAVLAEEANLSSSLSPLPSPRFLEISKLILDAASDNVASASTVRSLLKDIREVRQAKLRAAIIPQVGVEGTGLNGEYLQFPNLTPMEINELRPFFVRAMGVMGGLSAPGKEDDALGEAQGGRQGRGRTPDDD